MILSEIQEEIYIKLDEPTDGTGFVNDAELTAYINEAQFDINLKTRSVWGQSSPTVDVNHNAFDYPSDSVMFMERVLYNKSGNERYLYPKTINYIDDTQEGWEANSYGIPEYYYTLNTNEKGYVEVPFNADTTLTADYIIIPTALSSSTDTSVIDTKLHECLILFPLYRVLLKEQDRENIDRAMRYYNEYLLLIHQFKTPSLKRKRGLQARIGVR